MTHAYPESYLNKAKDCLAEMFDFLINDNQIEADQAYEMFIATGFAEMFEKGYVEVISGISGNELGTKVLKTAHTKSFKPQTFSSKRSPEYWAGAMLCEYQWKTGRRFIDILSKKKFTDIIAMYPIYNSLTVDQFCECLEKEFAELPYVSKLKMIREARGISQSELARESGVNIRNIQMYEQGNNDIDKAQAKALYKMSVVLGCNIEDLLDNPMN